MQLTNEQIHSLYGQDVQDESGSRIGSVGQIWADAEGDPTWVSVKTDVVGRREPMAPIVGARIRNGQLTVPYDKSTVKNAPKVDAGSDQPLGGNEINQLYRHYGLEQPQQPTQQRRTPQDQQELTRSEERLRVGTQSEPAGSARLRKYVVTEDVHTVVPVEHDEVQVERIPVRPTDRDVNAEIGEAERELTLRRERPVVSKDRVPVERVRLVRDEIVEDQPIDEQVQRERIDAEVPEPARRRA